MGTAPEPNLRPPVLLTSDHETASFDCGQPELDNWLKSRALRNQSSNASRTYVICEGAGVIAYYALAAGSVRHVAAIGRARRNMPDPVPAMVLGRLAIHKDWQGKGLGGDLLRDALLRTLQAADIIGIKVVLVHAISEAAKRFYQHYGFRASPISSMTLMITLDDIRTALRMPD